jgi:hypothetical protein
MRRSLIVTLLTISTILFSNAAHSEGAYVYVDDMSKLSYQMLKPGIVYFRNLNSFNKDVTGCCYAFYLDINSNYGNGAWAVIQAQMLIKGPLYLHVTKKDPPAFGDPAIVDHFGMWQ